MENSEDFIKGFADSLLSLADVVSEKSPEKGKELTDSMYELKKKLNELSDVSKDLRGLQEQLTKNL